MPKPPVPAELPLLVVDATEWFHDPVLAAHVTPRHWRRLPKRAAVAAKLLLAELQRARRVATWCVPPELAMAAPELLREQGW